MQVRMSASGNFDKATKWLTNLQTRSPAAALDRIGAQGQKALMQATPRGDTGETANGWKYKVIKTKYGWQLYWYNNSHPEAETSVAKLINFGHGTKNGGYVPPVPFIHSAIAGVLAAGGETVAKEMIK